MLNSLDDVGQIKDHRPDRGTSRGIERLGTGVDPTIVSEGHDHAFDSKQQPDPAELEASEMNRLLDKISARGIASLSEVERHFLDAIARRRRDERH